MLRMLTVAVLLALAGPVLAHPHGWIDMQSRVLFDGDGRITGLRQVWLFDELYSAFILDEIRLAGEGEEEGLAALAHEDVAALAPHDYFTVVEVAGERQAFAPVTRYDNGLTDGRIWLRFDLPLAAPVEPQRREVRYAVFDPTYYIEILHVGDPPVRLDAPGADACGFRLIEPEPAAEIVNFAAALDMNATDDAGLGRHFAQWVELACTAP